VADPHGWLLPTSNASALSEHIVAHIFSDEEMKRSGVQVGVAMVSSMGEFEYSEPDAFARALFDDWGIGFPDTQNGVLIVMCVGDRIVSIQTAAGSVRWFPDRKAEVAIEHMKPHLRMGAYDKAVESGVDAIFRSWTSHAQSAAHASSITAQNGEEYGPWYGGAVFGVIFFAVLVLFVTFMVSVDTQNDADPAPTTGEEELNLDGKCCLCLFTADKDEESVRVLSCAHRVHITCFSTWEKQYKKDAEECPVCGCNPREMLTKEQQASWHAWTQSECGRSHCCCEDDHLINALMWRHVLFPRRLCYTTPSPSTASLNKTESAKVVGAVVKTGLSIAFGGGKSFGGGGASGGW